MTELAQDNPLLAGTRNTPKLGLGGFLHRLAAFLLDWIFIIATLHLLSRFLGPLFTALGVWSPYVTAAMVFLYFALMNGPLGNGRTLGKMLLDVRLTDYNGGVASYRQSFLRTLLLYPIFLVAPLMELFFANSESVRGRWLLGFTPSFVMLAMWISVALSTAFSPFKQGLHDYFLRTLVRKGKPGDSCPSFEEIADQIGSDWPKFHRQPIYSGGVSFVAFLLALHILTYPRDAKFNPTAKALLELKKEPFFGQDAITYPLISLDQLIFEFGEEGIPKGFQFDGGTTETATLCVQIIRPSSWQPLLGDGTVEQLARQSMDRYYETVLPPLAESLATSTFPREKKVAEVWAESNIRIVYFIVSIASMNPYPFGPKQIHAYYEKTFPPVIAPSISSKAADSP